MAIPIRFVEKMKDTLTNQDKKTFLTSQQELFLAEYTNPKSVNFGNAKQSALKAGYTETYADNITTLMPDWLLENIGDMKRLRKAEKVLDKTLDYEPVSEDGKIDTSLLSIQNKTAQFITERLDKDKYSQKKEIDINVLTQEDKDKLLGLLPR